MFGRPATIYFQGLGDADTVISTGSIRVAGIVLSNVREPKGNDTTEDMFIFRDNDDNIITRLIVPTEDTVVFDIEFIADNGLKYDSSIDVDLDPTVNPEVFITVFYNYEGA